MPPIRATASSTCSFPVTGAVTTLSPFSADTGTMLEINAHPSRLDLDDIHAAAARDHGIPIVINTDAHSTARLDEMEYGVYQARRGGLEREHVANTRTWAQFKRLLRH